MLEETLVEAMQSIISSVGTATEFLKGEIPIVIQEILSFNLAYESLIAIVSFIVLSLCIVEVGRKVRKDPDFLSRKTTDSEDLMMIVPLLVCGGLSIASVCVMFMSIKAILMITLAPRLYILEYVADLAT